MNDLGRTREAHGRRLAILEELEGWNDPMGHELDADLLYLVGRGLVEKKYSRASFLYRRTARGSGYLAQEDPKER